MSDETVKTKREPKPARPGPEVWDDLMLEVENMSDDVRSNLEKGNLSAGVRMRQKLKRLKTLCSELSRATLAADKVMKESRKAKREATKATEAATTT